MQAKTLLLSLLLATAALAFVPSADAATTVCTSATSTSCGGYVCTSKDSDPSWSDDECVDKGDVDRCQFQSDCCSTTGFWCPERE